MFEKQMNLKNEDEAACSGNFDLEIEKKEACCLLEKCGAQQLRPVMRAKEQN
jgi:hypothetical protein